MPEVTDPDLLAALNGSAPAAGPIYGAPDPNTTFKVRDDVRADRGIAIQEANAARSAQNDAARLQLERERLRLAQDESARAAKAVEAKTGPKNANLDSIVEQINRVTQLYNNGVGREGLLNLFGALDAIGPQAGQFNSAGQGVADQGLAAFRVPGVGAQSDLEARQFAMANTPQAGDWDIAIEEKLRNIKGRVDANRKAMGLPPAQWDELKTDEGLTGSVTDTGSGYDPDVAPPTVPPTAPGGGGGVTDGLLQGVGSIVEGAASIPAIVVDPIATTLGRALGYDNYTSDFASQVRSDLGLPANQDRTADAIIQGGVGALTGSLAARGASALASGAGQNALAAFGATPVRDAAAGAGAALGGEVGQRVGGVPGQIVGTLAGGIGGYGAANRVTRAALAESAPNALSMAAQRQGVDLLPAEAGGPAARAITTGTRASPLSVAPVVRASQRSQDQLGAAARRVAESQGSVVTSDVAGNNIRNAATRFTKQTSERGSALYNRAAEAARGVRIKPNQTISRIDEYIARASENPASSEGVVQELASLRDNIANGVSVQGLRDARTALSQGVYDGKLRSGADQAMWKDILGNLSSDIDAGLRSVGKDGAANMFKRADAFWRDRVEHIDQVLQPILGNDRGGEQIVDAIETMARGKMGGGARLSRLLSNMTPQEAGNVRATIVDRLGKATPGAQNAAGDSFSPATFLTNWNKMTPQAKASLFSDKQLRADLNDIALIAEGKKTSQSMANFSNTGVAVGSNVGAAVALAAAHPVMVALGAGAQYATGRLMASPRFARALAKSAKMPPQVAQRSLVQNLATIAAREPLLASDARGLQQYLQQAVNQSPAPRAAASEQERDRRREPPQ